MTDKLYVYKKTRIANGDEEIVLSISREPNCPKGYAMFLLGTIPLEVWWGIAKQ